MDNTTTITFRAQSRSVRVKAPASGYRANPEINQKVSVSGGGTIYTTDFGGETQKLQVQLRRLTRTEYAALKEFILTTCRGSAFSFDLTDYQGTHQNLHYISGLEGAELHRGDLFNVTLQLQKSTDQSIRLGQNLITNPNLTLNSDGRTIEGWQLSNDRNNAVPDPTPAAMQNVDISEDFGTRALQVVDTDLDVERFFFTEKFPIADYRYTVSGRVSRTAGERTVYLYVIFFDMDGNKANAPSRSGWAGNWSGNYHYYIGFLAPHAGNNVWNQYSVTFGPGSNTPVPPAAKSFEIGVYLSQAGLREPYLTATFRLADFSVIVTP